MIEGMTMQASVTPQMLHALGCGSAVGNAPFIASCAWFCWWAWVRRHDCDGYHKVQGAVLSICNPLPSTVPKWVRWLNPSGSGGGGATQLSVGGFWRSPTRIRTENMVRLAGWGTTKSELRPPTHEGDRQT